MQAKSTHALPDVRDLRTSGNGCYQSPPFLRPRDQKKRRLWGREWSKSVFSSSAHALSVVDCPESLFSLKIRGDERKTSERASVTYEGFVLQFVTAPFNNMRTLKFKAQPTNAFYATANQMFGGSSQLPTTAVRAVIKS